MTTPVFEIRITPAKIEEWKKELDSIGHQIATLVQKREKLQGRINAISLFIDDEQQITLPGMEESDERSPMLSQLSESNRAPLLHEMPPPEAIRSVLRNAGAPLTKDEIRERLRLANFPMIKFRHDGGYFHTIISRMAKAEKLVIQGGKVKLLE